MTRMSTPPAHAPSRRRKPAGEARPSPDRAALLRLRKDLIRSQDTLDTLLDDLHRPPDPPGPDGPEPTRPARGRPARRPAGARWKGVDPLAPRSVTHVSVELRPMGRAVVRLDDVRLELSRGVAVLLDVLAAADAADGDGGVAWKTVPEIRDRLAQRLGRKLEVHALDELVRRLRSDLMAAGFSRDLVQVHPARGKRIAMLHPGHRGPIDD